MNLDNLVTIGIDAACAFVTMNLINMLRRGVFGLGPKQWLNAPKTKRERTGRLILLAAIAALATSSVFAARSYSGSWQGYIGEWLSRAIITWLLCLGQFDAAKLIWPTAFGRKEDAHDQSVD